MDPPRANLAVIVFGAAALQSASGVAEFAGAGVAKSPAASGDPALIAPASTAGEETVTRRCISPPDHQCLDQVGRTSRVAQLYAHPGSTVVVHFSSHPLSTLALLVSAHAFASLSAPLSPSPTRARHALPPAVFFSRSLQSQRAQRVRWCGAGGLDRRAAERSCGAVASASPRRSRRSGRSAALARRGGGSPGHPRQDAHAGSASRSCAGSAPGRSGLALRRLAARP